MGVWKLIIVVVTSRALVAAGTQIPSCFGILIPVGCNNPVVQSTENSKTISNSPLNARFLSHHLSKPTTIAGLSQETSGLNMPAASGALDSNPQIMKPVMSQFQSESTGYNFLHQNGRSDDDAGNHHDHHEDKNIFYKFEYAVDDQKTGDVKSHHEERKGDNVVGEYTVLEDKGIVRKVKYNADWKSGFHAVVTREKLVQTTM